jgi:hypothetical protein
MTRRDKHPNANQLASLAVDELRPRKAAKIEAHVAHCEQCTRTCLQLGAIRAMLASVSYPPMPENLSARIGSAISREAQQRLAASPATETGRRDLPARRKRAGVGGSWQLPGLSVAAMRLAGAVGAVVIAVAGSFLGAETVGTGITRSPSSPLAGAAAPAQQMSLGPDVTYGQPGPFHSVRAVESRVDFVPAHLRAEAISAVHAAEDLEAFPALRSASTATTLGGVAEVSFDSPNARRLAGCIGLLAPGQTVLIIDLARFQGKPASVIVTAATVVSEAEARVVGPSCSAMTKDVLTQAALGYP